MITRLATLSLLVGGVAAAADAPAPRTVNRRLQDMNGNYFCNCPCDPDNEYDTPPVNSALVWMYDTFPIESVLAKSEYLTEHKILDGQDDQDPPNFYKGLCIKDDDVFDLLYDYGDQVFCDTECDGDENADIDTDVTLDSEAGDYFDFVSDSEEVSDEDGFDEDGNVVESSSIDALDKAADLADGVLDGEIDTSYSAPEEGEDAEEEDADEFDFVVSSSYDSSEEYEPSDTVSDSTESMDSFDAAADGEDPDGDLDDIDVEDSDESIDGTEQGFLAFMARSTTVIDETATPDDYSSDEDISPP